MKKVFLVIVLVFTAFLTSCIPHKDTVYLQNNNSSNDSLQILVEQQKPYRVQINDILSVRVKALDQENVSILNPLGEGNLNADSAERAYFDGFTVDTHGQIKIPTLGKINVLGYTTEEIQDMVQEKLLKEQFKETANIFVTVKLSGFRFTVNGEVRKPGTTLLFQDRVTVLEAIANVGEITDTGNRKEVAIIRQYPQGQQIHHIDLTDIKVMSSPYYYIQPNDIIYVKPVKQKSWGTGTTGLQTFTTLASIISVIGTTILLIQR